VDARLHHVQGKTEHVKPAELLELLREFYADKAKMCQRHVAAARLVIDYNFNNTYQYVINREDVQLTWLLDAIADLGGSVDNVPAQDIQASGKPADIQARVIREDRDAAQGLVDGWRDRVERVTNARNKNVLRVILGETLEAKRFFDQMIAGREDLLGRRADGMGTPGAVLPTRWVGTKT
jgi:hypothetical protein